MSLLTEIWAGFKAARKGEPPPAVPYAGRTGPVWAWRGAGAGLDWDAEAGDPRGTSILAIALRWLQTNAAAVPLAVRQGATEADGKFLPDAPATLLLANGNRVYDGVTLRQSLIPDYLSYGAGYLIKGWNANRTQLLELWYEPYQTIRPHWPDDGSAWVDYWEVQRDGRWIKIPYADDVIPWNRGVPLQTTRRPPDPLYAFRQERALANQVNLYLATVLTNQGVVGGLVTPKVGGRKIDNPAGLKDRLETLTTGDNRGRWMVFDEPMDVTLPNSAPDTMPVERLDGRTEERLTAAMGLDRLVVGLGKDGTFSNQEGAEKHAWTNTVLPLLDDLCRTLTKHLLPDLAPGPKDRIAADTGGVRALQTNKLDEAKVHQTYVVSGIKTPNEVRKILGEKPHPDGDKLRGMAPPPPQLVAPPTDAPTDAPLPNGKPAPGDVPAELVPAKPGSNGKG